jgi:hypothetical protein
MTPKLAVVVLAGCLFASTLAAQQHFRGIGASVTSIPSASHSSGGSFSSRSYGTPGIPSSVTSITRSTHSSRGFSVQRDFRGHHGRGNHGRHGRGKKFVPIYVPYYSFPYYPYADPGFYPDGGTMSEADYPAEEPELPALTIFERRPGYKPPPVQPAEPSSAEKATAESEVAAAPAPEPVVEQTPTVLVFRDGRKLEIGNYAIQGETIFNLSGSGPRRIKLADLDLDSTIKLNEDRGSEFRLPKKFRG